MKSSRLMSILRLLRLSKQNIGISVILAFFSALSDGLSLSLLVPVFRGLFADSFTSLYHFPLLGTFLESNSELINNRKAYVFAVLLLVIFFSSIIKSVFQFLSLTIMCFEANNGLHNIRTQVYDRYLKFGKMYFDQRNGGDFHQILMNYTERITVCFRGVSTAILALFSSIIYLVLMIRISPVLTFVSVSIFPITHYVFNKVVKKIQISSADFTKAFTGLAEKISNSINCLPLIKSYCNENKEREWFEHASRQVSGFKFSIDKKNCFILPFQEVVMISMILFLVGIMSHLYVRHGIGDVATYLVFFVMLKKMSNSISQLLSFAGSYSEISGSIDSVLEIFNDKDKFIPKDGSKNFNGIQKSIVLKDLKFGYLGRSLRFNGLNLEFKANKMTAIVGESGSGKTTIINLLMRFYDPPEKSVLFDGEDLLSYRINSLRSHIALVDQRDMLFNASVKFNLVYGLNRQVSDEELKDALSQAQLTNLLEGLPLGLDTVIGDRGVQLSGGERQRLQIARAILKDAQIMIFDEATSALDSGTEKLIQKAVLNLLEGKTSIIVAHRLSTIKKADEIILLENGAVVEKGGFEELMSRKKQFYRYWTDQGLVV